MGILINILAILMGAFGLILLFGGALNKHIGLIIAGLTFTIGAWLAFKSDSLMPIIVAVIISFILRKLGLDPSAKKIFSDRDLINMAMPNDLKEHSTEDVRKGIKELAKKNKSAIEINFISVVIPISVIEEKCKDIGGIKGILELNKKWIGYKISYNEYLYKDSVMSPDDMGLIIEFWKKHGLITSEERDGKKYWKDLCVIDQFSGPTLPCDWIEYDRSTFSASIKPHS